MLIYINQYLHSLRKYLVCTMLIEIFTRLCDTGFNNTDKRYYLTERKYVLKKLI